MTESSIQEGKGKYKIRVDLNVLTHLGINLYSNTPAVISEAIANSYDADADNVWIDLDSKNGRIVIRDDGEGMDLDDINNRFLTVGYNRRNPEENRSITKKYKRNVMGRKGIGKLSLFSLANKIEVRTAKNNTREGLLMRRDIIEEKIKSNPKEPEYFPEELPPESINLDKGTEITLLELKVKKLNSVALKRKIARRFSIIGQKNNFRVFLNKVEITPEDRGYFSNLQFIWTFGKKDDDQQVDYKELCKNLEGTRPPIVLPGSIEYLGEKQEVYGWIGTVHSPKQLRDGYTEEDGKSDNGENNIVNEQDNLNALVILSRGKVVQEDILGQFPEARVFSKYVVGEINADFLDVDEEPDITTTSRQTVNNNDERYIALKKWIRERLQVIGDTWSAWRNEAGERKALEIPEIKEWYDGLSSDDKKLAKKMFGRINEAEVESDRRLSELFRYSVIAFESMKQKRVLSKLEMLKVMDVEAIGKVFNGVDEIAAVLYYQISKERVEIISALAKAVDDNQKEAIIQKFIFEHLWLLDPSWEMATDVDPSMESTFRKEFKGLNDRLSDEQKDSRYDIKFKSTSGMIVVIELKRAKRNLSQTDLFDQLSKYSDIMTKATRGIGGNTPFEIVCIIGKYPPEWDKNKEMAVKFSQSIEPYNARIVLYKDLITKAYKAYQEYLKKQKEASKIVDMLNKISPEIGIMEDQLEKTS